MLGKSRPAQDKRAKAQSAGRGREVASVTTAALSHTDDIALRQRRYMLTQLVRIICIALAATLPVAAGWKMVFIAGAIILPWFGVVAANAGPTVNRSKPNSIVARSEPVTSPPGRPELGAGRVIDAEQ